MSADRRSPDDESGPAAAGERASASRLRIEVSATRASDGRLPLASASRVSAAMPAVRLSGSQAAVTGGVLQYPLQLVVVAASTGGPQALGDFLCALPPKPAAPIIVVQHMNQHFIAAFVERLAKDVKVPLGVAQGRELIYAGQVWFAPGGRHLLVERYGLGLRVRLTDSAPLNGCRPSADETLTSAASTVGAKMLAVILSGIGRDGRDGCRAVKQAGGQVLVQDSASAAVAEMPEAVAREQLAEGAYPPSELGLRVGRKLAYGR